MKRSFDANVSRVRPRQRLSAVALREELSESIADDLALALIRPRRGEVARAEEEARLAQEREEKARAEEEARLAREREEKARAEEEARLAREREEKARAEEEARLAREREEKARAEEESRRAQILARLASLPAPAERAERASEPPAPAPKLNDDLAQTLKRARSALRARLAAPGGETLQEGKARIAELRNRLAAARPAAVASTVDPRA